MRPVADFALAYGFVPPGAMRSPGAAIGLAMNGNRVRALRTLDTARAIGAAIGGGDVLIGLMTEAGADGREVEMARLERVRDEMRNRACP